MVEYPSLRDQGIWKEAFFGQGNETKFLREACPLKRNGNQYRFFHQSLLEDSLARAVFEPQKRRIGVPEVLEPTAIASRRGNINSDFRPESHSVSEDMADAIEQPMLESPLGRMSSVGELSILRFLKGTSLQETAAGGDWRSKTGTTVPETIRVAAANAITIVVRSGVQFNEADLRGIRIPGADLSEGAFEYTQLQGADTRNVILRSSSLQEANLSGAQMAGVQFGELPFLEEGSEVNCCIYSPDCKTFAVGLESGNISIYTTSD